MKSEKKQQQKRISIVSIKMVRESSVLYNIRKISSPNDAVELGIKLLDHIIIGNNSYKSFKEEGLI